MALTETDLTQFLEENKERIMAASRDAVIEKIKESVKWHIPDVVQTQVNTFFKDEIAPEIAKLLQEQKGPIVDAAKKTAVAMANALAEKMMEKVVKDLDGYRAEEVFKALLGVKSRY